MNNNKIKDIVIVGGGTSGWMTAAMLSKLYPSQLDITLVESDTIGTIGVGEATIPPLQIFNNVLGINEQDFIHQTQATIKLGIQFENWGKLGDKYMHAFGEFGKDIGYTAFHHYWLADNPDPKSLWDYSFNYQAAIQGKFSPTPRIHNNQLAGLTHAYHFDAGLYAKLLREYSIEKGVNRIEGKVSQVNQDEHEFITSLTLENGNTVAGDLFIDCSGLHGVLLDKVYKVGFDSYQHWLPCDSAWAVPCEKVEPIIPYTRSIAHKNGWQWRIPLQHRTGNGLVFASSKMSDADAKQLLLDNLDAPAIGEPRLIRFTPGRRQQQWVKNCVAIGLSSGFLEPLESTSIHLVQTAIIRLTKLMPHAQINPSLIDEYNRQAKLEFEQIRDFIILHYHLNHRADSCETDNSDDIWQACREMDIPESLQQKIALFKDTGNLFRQQENLFTNEAWLQVMVGQGIIPEDYNPLANVITNAQRLEFLANLKAIYAQNLSQITSHQQFLSTCG
ncbi:tryptophan halogenase family protein [Shewanella aestuarii]|uniref:Tryptophan 7-halogenase n=1 Tax=Shewanella aestuarii TaxID=1028752 RepID=A0A6G9QJQ1_9GAMM|nr:tryptophan halogenase family protein [Shewanella aestuarii]QIR14702.1 tryptophan 7-halogenase [Shewanella aestuarii]